MGFRKFSWNEPVTEIGENRITNKGFKQSDIEAHSLKFDFKNWKLSSEHQFSERFGSECTDNQDNQGVHNCALGHLVIVILKLRLVSDCP